MVLMVEASTEHLTSPVPSALAISGSLPISRWRLIFFQYQGGVVDEAAIAKVNPPRVVRLIVWPHAAKPTITARIESGIDRKIANDDRTLPKKIR
jgi:hypothetical protein